MKKCSVNRLRRLAGMIVICCIFAGISTAQEIERSAKTEFIGGRECYLHTVKAGQTLYAIAKAYEVSIQEIVKMNPDAEKGLKPNQVLKVPVATAAASGVYIMHTVKDKETLSEIAEQYHIKLSDIYNLNPGLKPDIKPGQKLKLPKTEKAAEPRPEGKFQLHIVQPDETLFSIAKKYGVTTDELKKVNPGLSETILIGQQIRVPVKSATVPVAEKPKDTVKFECARTGMKSSYNIGLLVPLYLNRMYEIDTGDIEKSAGNFTSFSFIGFYEGFLLALDSIEKSGIRVKLAVDDVCEDTADIAEVLEKPAYAATDLVIGPFFSRTFTVASRWALKKNVKIVNPFSSNSEFVTANHCVFKNVASVRQQAVQTADYIIKTWPGCKVLMVYSTFDADSSFRTELKAAFEKGDTLQYAFHAVNYTATGLSGVSSRLSADKANIVISLLHNEVTVSNYIRGMSELSFSHPIVVFGMKQWEEYNSLELAYLQNLKLHIISSSFIDYQQPAVKGFIMKYRDQYYTEPDAYAFAGYDCAMYYLNALRLYGTDFQHCLDKYHPALLQTTLEFEHAGDNGYENRKICIYRYDNYKQVDAYANPLKTVEVNKKEK